MRRPFDPAPALLAWYDRAGRRLPWRVAEGAADPYRVWLSEVMLQQTTAAAVAPRFERFAARWPSVEALAAAPEADVMGEWAGLGYYARARNLIAAARVLAAGGFPRDMAGWRRLPGVGDYTAAAVAAIAFGERVLPIDANIARVGARLLAADLEAPALRAALGPAVPRDRPGDFAQALMDLGSAVCRPRAPDCSVCPLSRGCAGFASGAPERWPARRVKAAKPERRGVAYWLEADGGVLIVRRPARGLLGGMAALPSSEWGEEASGGAPIAADWRVLATPARHVFTHFRLTLDVAVARLAARPAGLGGEWVLPGELGGLPTVFAKAAWLAMAAR